MVIQANIQTFIVVVCYSPASSMEIFRLTELLNMYFSYSEYAAARTDAHAHLSRLIFHPLCVAERRVVWPRRPNRCLVLVSCANARRRGACAVFETIAAVRCVALLNGGSAWSDEHRVLLRSPHGRVHRHSSTHRRYRPVHAAADTESALRILRAP